MSTRHRRLWSRRVMGARRVAGAAAGVHYTDHLAEGRRSSSRLHESRRCRLVGMPFVWYSRYSQLAGDSQASRS